MSADVPPATPEDLLRAACGYARRGLPVFPCRSAPETITVKGKAEERDAKSPIPRNGWKSATTDFDQIERWWRERPDALIGLATGPAAGLFVVDLDIDPEKGLDGFATWEKLTAKFNVPLTRWQETPRGGHHLFWKWPGDDRLRGRKLTVSTGQLGQRGPVGKRLSAPGVDIRGAGGYVILPPSRLADGRAYAWAPDLPPLRTAPDWLLDLFAVDPDAAAPPPSTPPAGAQPSEPPVVYLDDCPAALRASLALHWGVPWRAQAAQAAVRPLSERAAARGRGRSAGGRRAAPKLTAEKLDRRWADKALAAECARLRYAVTGGRNGQLNASSYTLGRIVGAGLLTDDAVREALLSACEGNGLLRDDGRGQCLATIASGLQAGRLNPRTRTTANQEEKTA